MFLGIISRSTYLRSNVTRTVTSRKASTRHTKTTFEICSKLTYKTPEQRHRRCSDVFYVDFEQILHCSGVFIIDLMSQIISRGSLRRHKKCYRGNFETFIAFFGVLGWPSLNFLRQCKVVLTHLGPVLLLAEIVVFKFGKKTSS